MFCKYFWTLWLIYLCQFLNNNSIPCFFSCALLKCLWQSQARGWVLSISSKLEKWFVSVADQLHFAQFALWTLQEKHCQMPRTVVQPDPSPQAFLELGTGLSWKATQSGRVWRRCTGCNLRWYRSTQFNWQSYHWHPLSVLFLPLKLHFGGYSTSTEKSPAAAKYDTLSAAKENIRCNLSIEFSCTPAHWDVMRFGGKQNSS